MIKKITYYICSCCKFISYKEITKCPACSHTKDGLIIRKGAKDD